MPVNERLPAEALIRNLFPKSMFVSGAKSVCVCGIAADLVLSRGVRELAGMKSRENLVRLKQFKVGEKRRHLLQLDMMIAEFERMAAELEAQISSEEKKSGITDVNHFAYPTFAKAARQRRDNLRASQSDLMQQRASAQAILSEAEAELSKAEALESRDTKTRDVEHSSTRGAMIG